MNTDIEKQIKELEQQFTQKGWKFPTWAANDRQNYLLALQVSIGVDKMCSEEEIVIDLKAELKNRMELPEPSELDDAQLTKKLHEVIDLLAQFHFKMDFTNYFDDRKLYEAILTDILEEPISIKENCKGALIHHDVTTADEAIHDAKYEDEDIPIKADRDNWLSELAEKYRNSPLPKVTRDLGRIPAF